MMKRSLVLSFLVASFLSAQSRPAITGISHMCVYASDAAARDNFYGHILGAFKGHDPFDAKGSLYYFSPTQFVEVLPLPADHPDSKMACVAYNTADEAGLLRNMGSQSALHTKRTGAAGFR